MYFFEAGMKGSGKTSFNDFAMERLNAEGYKFGSIDYGPRCEHFLKLYHSIIEQFDNDENLIAKHLLKTGQYDAFHYGEMLCKAFGSPLVDGEKVFFHNQIYREDTKSDFVSFLKELSQNSEFDHYLCAGNPRSWDQFEGIFEIIDPRQCYLINLISSGQMLKKRIAADADRNRPFEKRLEDSVALEKMWEPHYNKMIFEFRRYYSDQILEYMTYDVKGDDFVDVDQTSLYNIICDDMIQIIRKNDFYKKK